MITPLSIFGDRYFSSLLSPVCIALLGILLGFSAPAQISVGPSGVGPITFSTLPPVTEWATRNVQPNSGSAVGNIAQLDALVQTNAAAAIAAPLAASDLNPPNAAGAATWSSSGQYVQTRASGNTATLLMATLRNDSGAVLSGVTVGYDLSIIAATEQIPGHLVYFSQSGATGTWQRVNTDTGSAGHKVASLRVPIWTNGALLFVVWADDNADVTTDSSVQIDNFAVTPISAAPIILQQPTDVSIAPGNQLTLTVGADGVPPFTYVWRRDGTNLPNATNSFLTITNAQESDSGTYSVLVSNAYGSVLSSNAVATVLCVAGPQFQVQPTGQTMSTGMIALSVSTTGTLPIAYQWYRGSVLLAGETNSTFIKPAAAVEDTGLYYVIATNCGGAVRSSNAPVVVTGLPTVLLALTNQTWRYDQSGVDLGTAWITTNYDDASWLSGRGVFALENQTSLNPLTNTVLSLTSLGVRVRTYYFRTEAVFTNIPAETTLVFSNYFDDGAVVYVNGQELFRQNMPAGAVRYNTLTPTDGPVTEGVFSVSNFPGSVLKVGTNTLAVEVHQTSDSSSDIAFGMSISTARVPISFLAITNQPDDVFVEETRPWQLSVDVSGSGARYQWFKDDMPIPGADGTTLTIAGASTNDIGGYFVVVSNALHSVTSRIAQVTVTIDTMPPRLLRADGLDSTHVLLTFSETIDFGSVTNTDNYAIWNTFGDTAVPLMAVMSDGTNVLLTTSARSGVNWIVTVMNIRDASPHSNAIAANAQAPIATSADLIPYVTDWRFYDPFPAFGEDPNPPSDWSQSTFDVPPIWGEGQGTFLASLAPWENPVPANSSLTLQAATAVYFRHAFTSFASPVGFSARLEHFASDGVVFYVNGREVDRVNMPAGPVTPFTVASTARSNSIISSTELAAEVFQPGSNVLAAELHAWDLNATLKAFGARLSVRSESQAVGPIVITSGPEDSTVLEGRPALFTVHGVGAASVQWQLDGTNISGATDSTLRLTSRSELNGARVSVLLSNATAWAASTNATLTVIFDTNAPVIVDGIVTGPDRAVIRFSEAVDAGTATNIANYMVTNLAGQVKAIGSASLTNGSNVVLTFSSPLSFDAYVARVSNVRDISTAGNVIAPFSTVRLGFAYGVAPMSGVWRYDDDGIDRGTAWRGTGYNDSAWTEGAALFAGRAGTLPALPEPPRTTLSLSNNGVGTPTFYFRKSFAAFVGPVATLTINTIVDDGCVIYLNGVEVKRLRVPVPATFNTLASSPAVGDPVVEGPFTFTVTNLLNGTNVIAVEVHQQSLTSSDVYWAGDFVISTPAEVLPAPVIDSCPAIPWTFPRPIVSLSSGGANPTVMVSWTRPITNDSFCAQRANFMLERAYQLELPPNTTDWSEVTNVSPVTLPATNASQFFRLRLLP